MKKRLYKVSIILIVLIFAGLLYAFAATHFGFWIPCMFHQVTGWDCPGCGVSRMCLALLGGDLSGAFHWNPVLLCLLPLILYLLGYMGYRFIRFGDMKLMRWQTILCWILVIILLSFGVLRNLD